MHNRTNMTSLALALDLTCYEGLYSQTHTVRMKSELVKVVNKVLRIVIVNHLAALTEESGDRFEM